MPLTSFSTFNADMSEDPIDQPIPNNQDIPRDELDIFYRQESAFLPDGKTFSQLTEEELKLLKNRYRFDPMRPGMYQGITGLGPNMI